MLDETGEPAVAVTANALAGASGAGVDPRAITSLRAALAALDPAGDLAGLPGGQRHRPAPRQRVPVGGEFLEAVSDADDQIRDWLRDVKQLRNKSPPRRTRPTPTGNTRNGTCKPPGRPWPPRTPCPPRGLRGCQAARPPRSPPPKQPSPWRRPVRDAKRRIGICEDTAEIRTRSPAGSSRPANASPGAARPRRGLRADLRFIRRGGKMPILGRWIEGAPA